jgi:hypothetical protein
MARPKSTAPLKKQLSLSVTDQTRLELAYIAAHRQKSASALIAEWASAEARKIAKKEGKPLPIVDPDQITMYESGKEKKSEKKGDAHREKKAVK